jgi:hypothetical protein
VTAWPDDRGAPYGDRDAPYGERGPRPDDRPDPYRDRDARAGDRAGPRSDRGAWTGDRDGAYGGGDPRPPSGAGPAPDERAGARERSLPGPRTILIVAAVLAVTVGVCSQILPRAAGSRSGVITDAFDRTAQGLGTTGSGETWETPTSGAWATRDGEAFVTTPNTNAGGRTLALVDLGSDNGSVSATIAQSSVGWGLVFRYRGPTEFWTLGAAAKYASYSVQHITEGRAEAVDRVPMARQSPGTVVTVQFQGPTITVLLDGKAVKTVTDPAGGNGGRKVGLVLGDGTSTEAHWRAFEARRLALSPPRPATTAGAKPGPTAAPGSAPASVPPDPTTAPTSAPTTRAKR